MSEPKATPGPWRLSWHMTTGWAEQARHGADAEDRANAHLIAAAPELYKALNVIRNQWAGHAEQCALVTTGYRAKCDCDWPKLAKQADAALAKARGEPQPPAHPYPEDHGQNLREPT